MKKLTRGFYKGFEDYKNNVLIPVCENVHNWEQTQMPNKTVVLGIKVQDVMPVPQYYFTLILFNEKITVLLTAEGKRAFKVRAKKNPNVLKEFLGAIKKLVKENK